MKHGGEEAATHEGRAPSSKLGWWAHLSAEQKAFFAATRKENLGGMKEAVAAGASVETVVHEHGFTAYHWAAVTGNFEIMEWLARKGANHSARDKQGGTPMHYAAIGGHVAALECLTAKGADIEAVSVNGWSPMHTAVQNGHVAAAEWLEKQIYGLSTLRAFTNHPHKPTPDTMPIATRLMARRTKLDQKAVSTAPSASSMKSDIIVDDALKYLVQVTIAAPEFNC